MPALLPFAQTRFRSPGFSRLAAAIATALVAAPAVAGGDVRHVSAIRYAEERGGHVSSRLELRPPSTAAHTAAQSRGNVPAARAVTRAVTSCLDDGGPGTLRSVVEAAGEGDTIDLGGLACGSIVLQHGMIEVNWAIDSLVIQGPGRDALTIDGAGQSAVFYYSGTGTLDLRDLSIAHALAVDAWGACVCASGGNVNLDRVTLSSCTSHQVTDQRGSVEGGAVFAFGNVSVRDSEIRDSTASSELPGAVPDGSGGSIVINPVLGGAVATIIGDITIQRSRISGNSAVALAGGGVGEVRGGALHTRAGNITVSDSVLAGNRVSSAFEDLGGYPSFAVGGSLYSNFGQLTIKNSTISDNKVESSANIYWDRGGGIAFSGTAARIENTTIENNRASGDGGGLHHQGHSLQLINSTISGNYAARGAGGLYDVSPTSLDHVTIAFNGSGGNTGGAVLLHSGEIFSSIVADNTAGGGKAADLQTGADAAVEGAYNLIGDAGSTPLPAETLHSDPQLLPLAENGGGTRTHALTAGSPAVDAGSNELNLDYDQRGNGYARVSGSAPDIGAFEVQQGEAIFSDGFETGIAIPRH